MKRCLIIILALVILVPGVLLAQDELTLEGLTATLKALAADQEVLASRITAQESRLRNLEDHVYAVMPVMGTPEPTATPDPQATPTPVSYGFTVVDQRDVSDGDVVRMVMSVELKGPYSQEVGAGIVNHLTVWYFWRSEVNAAAFLFFYPRDENDNTVPAGAIDWAPYGDWSRASEVKTGDYTHHSQTVRYWVGAE